MKIIDTILRAIIERVTQLEWHSEGAKIRLYVFEHLGQDGTPVDVKIQNWECDNITDQFTHAEFQEIKNCLYDFYKSKSNSAD